MQGELIFVLGPTAVGKTAYAIELARELGSPIINCDSRQIFKEMRIGTAVPSKEELELVRHYFIQTHTIEKPYTAGEYELEALELIEKLFRQHSHLVVCGGSCLYADALCNGLDAFPDADPQLRATLNSRLQSEGLEALRRELSLLDPDSFRTIDLSNPRRVVRALEVTIQTGKRYSQWKSSPKKSRPFSIRKIGLAREREILYDRINSRVEKMVADGLAEEARGLMEKRNLPALNTVGYKEMFQYLDGTISLERAKELISRNTRHYAKKQLSYWARDKEIEWVKL